MAENPVNGRCWQSPGLLYGPSNVKLKSRFRPVRSRTCAVRCDAWAELRFAQAAYSVFGNRSAGLHGERVTPMAASFSRAAYTQLLAAEFASLATRYTIALCERDLRLS